MLDLLPGLEPEYVPYKHGQTSFMLSNWIFKVFEIWSNVPYTSSYVYEYYCAFFSKQAASFCSTTAVLVGKSPPSLRCLSNLVLGLGDLWHWAWQDLGGRSLKYISLKSINILGMRWIAISWNMAYLHIFAISGVNMKTHSLRHTTLVENPAAMPDAKQRPKGAASSPKRLGG